MISKILKKYYMKKIIDQKPNKNKKNKKKKKKSVKFNCTRFERKRKNP